MGKQVLSSITARLIATASAIVFLVLVLVTSLVYLKTARSVESRGIDDLAAQSRLVRDQLETLSLGLRENAERSATAFASTLPGAIKVDSAQTIAVGELKAPVIQAGDLVLNNNTALVDKFASMTGGVATVFVRTGEDFLRVATSVKKEDGSRAVGTLLGKSHPAYASMVAGKPFVGPVKLFGREYMARYTPIEADGKVVALLFVGFDYTKQWSLMSAQIGGIKVGTLGYVYVLDARAGASNGTLLIHPRHAGKKVGDAGIEPHYKTILEQKEGTLRYELADGRRKVAAFDPAPSWNYIVATSLDIDELMSDARALRNLLLVLIPVALLVGGGLLGWMIRRALAPLDDLGRSVAALGAGDLTVRALCRNDDEIGRIGRGFNEMAEALGTLMKETLGTVDEVDQSAASMRSVSQKVVGGSRAQSDAASSVAAAVEQLSVSVDTVAHNAAETEALCQRTRVLAAEGAQVVQAAAREVSVIASSVQESSGAIRELGERSADIGRIVQVIRDIAEQTNLLALNAAIEAARAGEQGRGFAVVADEVRKLAERTSASTQEISTMVGSIQSQAQQASERMQQCNTQAGAGVAQAEAAASALSGINTAVDDALAKVTDIAGSIQEQSKAAQSIASHVERIAGMAESNTTSCAQVSETAERLASSAQRLKTGVARFSV